MMECEGCSILTELYRFCEDCIREASGIQAPWIGISTVHAVNLAGISDDLSSLKKHGSDVTLTRKIGQRKWVKNKYASGKLLPNRGLNIRGDD